MPLELRLHHRNGCNVGLMIWKKCWQSSISNWKISTTWMRAGLQSARRKRENVLSTLKFVYNFKQSLVVKNGLRWWNAFALMEKLSRLSSFSKPKLYPHNGFLRVSMVYGRLIVTKKGGQVMNTVWI